MSRWPVAGPSEYWLVATSPASNVLRITIISQVGLELWAPKVSRGRFLLLTILNSYQNIFGGTAVTQWLRRCAINRKVAGSIPAGVNGFFIDIKSFRSHYGPGVDSACNKNEYQENFWDKGGRCVRLTTLPPSCAVIMKSGNLNFLEPSGPLQACNWTALPLPIITFFAETPLMYFAGI